MQTSSAERRTQKRIPVQIPIEVIRPVLEVPIQVMNQDLCWGGASFILPDPEPVDGERLRLSLPWTRGERILVDAHVLRTSRLADGCSLVAVRFNSLSPPDHARLEKLLTMLKASETAPDRSGSTHLVRELEITANEVGELRDMLTQIATGRFKITVFDAYETNESISLLIAGTSNLSSIRLRARVAEGQATNQHRRYALHTITLEFEHPLESIRAFVDLLLGQLPAQDALGLDLSGIPPEWIHHPPFARAPDYAMRGRIRPEDESVIPKLRHYD